MRLGDLRSAKRDDVSIPAEAERELEALDAALRGEDVPEGMEGLEALVSDLRAERQEPEARFESRLDAWAAAGFPRGKRPSSRPSAGGAGATSNGFFKRLGSGERRAWAPAAAAVATLVVVVVSVAQLSEPGGSESLTGAPQGADVETSAEGGDFETTAPEADQVQEQGSLQAEPGAVRDNSASFSSPDDSFGLDSRESDGGGANRAQEVRKVERDAQITLGAPEDEVSDVSDEAIGVVQGANGVVLNSRVTDTESSARAVLEVRVPSATLDDTLAALSDLGTVQSRSEQADDITGSYVSAKDTLVGLRATRDNLASRIRDASTDEELASLQAQLASVNNRIAEAKGELDEVETRAQLATLTIVITSEGATDDGWSLGDALDDAGRVLEVAAGVALISAAVLVPLAIIAAIAFFVVAAANRRARERALDS